MLETIVNLHDFYSLNLWKILLGGLGWSSYTITGHIQIENSLTKILLHFPIIKTRWCDRG